MKINVLASGLTNVPRTWLIFKDISLDIIHKFKAELLITEKIYLEINDTGDQGCPRDSHNIIDYCCCLWLPPRG